MADLSHAKRQTDALFKSHKVTGFDIKSDSQEDKKVKASSKFVVTIEFEAND